MRKKQLSLLLMALIALLALAGCGGSGSGGDQTAGPDHGVDPDTGIAYVSSAVCIDCHNGYDPDIVAAYLQGKHVIHSDHIEADSEEVCLSCHDALGDGPGIEPLIDPADVPELGLAAVGCENCHGPGGEHFGGPPVPVSSPEAEVCAQCHDDQWDYITEAANHINYHPEGNGIYTDYADSAHADADGRNEAICVKCHNDEGARKYKDVETWESLQATLPVQVENDQGVTIEPHAIQCRTCHDAHNAGKLLKEEVSSRSAGLISSTENATCTNCHQAADAQLVSLYNSAGGLKDYATWEAEMLALAAEGITSDQPQGDLIYHGARWERVISSTHFDNPLTSYQSEDAELAPNLVEGYVVNAKDERTCRDCHNVHSADLTINNQWAMSGHGGELLEAKEAAEADGHTLEGAVEIRMAGADAGNAWPHYDWDATTEYDAVDGIVSDRGECQMCHTATGNKNFYDDPAGYALDGTGNDFSHLIGWSLDGGPNGETVSSGQNELLYCWSCHSDNQGALREAGAVTLASYTYNSPTLGVQPVTLPDVGASNICLNCHAGRNNVDDLVDDDRSSRFEGHHGTAGGTIFSDYTHIAYEFTGQNYANVSFFHHDEIGTAAYPDTGTGGPCAGCHMGDEANHTFSAVTWDEGPVMELVTPSGTINNVAVCNACHSDLTITDLAEEKEGFEMALGTLESLLENNPQNTYNTAILPTSNDNYETVALDGYGAFQNFKYLDDEPGAYAHNRFYAKRLIFDSIDLLEDGSLDGTINDYGNTWLPTTRP